MHTPSQDEALLDKWSESTTREKSEAIPLFLTNTVNMLTGKIGVLFLHRRKMKGF